MVDFICDYYSRIQSLPVVPHNKNGYIKSVLPSEAPEEPKSFESMMEDMEGKVLPGVTHWQSPTFFAWYPANSSFPAMLADMAAGALNMIGFSHQASPVGTEMEEVMLDWLAKACGLPTRFHVGAPGPGGGVIQGTSSEAVLVALLAARARTMRGRPPEDALRLVAYASDQTHFCYDKACRIGAVRHVRHVATTLDADWALRADDLAHAMRRDVEDGLIPFFVVATVGTTATCAVDPIAAVVEVATMHSAYVHVDAAYAGSAALAPELRHLFAGLEGVDSYSFNPHKWMLTNFDCCAMWVADRGPLLEALSISSYLVPDSGSIDYKDWQIPLGRRFRALKLYFVLNMYGTRALASYVRHHVALAAEFASRVAADSRLELAAPQCLGLVVFRVRGADDARNRALLNAINASGRVFISSTMLGGRLALRLAVGGSNTQLRDVDVAWEVLQHTLEDIAGAAAP